MRKAFPLKARTAVFALAAAAVAVYAAYSLFLAPKAERKSYAEFYALVGEGRVSEAALSTDEIRFTVPGTDTPKGQEYRTDNPQSPALKEYLLLHGVAVKEEKDVAALLSLLFDVIFYAFFFGIFAVAFRKFISPNTFRVVRNTGVRFADVVGMDALKRDMTQVMEILKAPAAFAAKGIRAPKGILLEGAPGNGKTLFARALAGEAKVNFIPAKATDFESMFMAIGPMKVKLLFRKARKRAPCIVFIDEFDGIGTRRNYSGSAIETENTRIVTALLNELDGFEPAKGILVLAAT
ncbi:MAG: AAA family ATPase, partial [Treponema sp.]|nr:AAA family ATPase [Treponema sp.]